MYGIKGRCFRLISELKTLLNENEKNTENILVRNGKIEFLDDVSDISDNFNAYNQGDIWSGKDFDDYALFKFKLDIPDFNEDYDYFLKVSTNKSGGHNMVRPQMLLIKDNIPIHGLDTNHEEICITKLANEKSIEFYVYAYSGLPKKTPYGKNIDMDISDGVRLYVSTFFKNKELSDFYYNLKTPYTYLQFFEENSFEYQKILNSINESLCIVDFRNPHSEEFYDSIKKANKYINDTLFDEKNKANGNATLVGHTHIDLAWLWPIRETKRKGARTFSNVISLMERYPDFVFGASQPQLYKWVKEDYPELYEKIKQKVKERKMLASCSVLDECMFASRDSSLF